MFEVELESVVDADADEADDVGGGLEAVGIALSVDPVSWGRFPCATVTDTKTQSRSSKQLISDAADKPRSKRILLVGYTQGGNWRGPCL